ncbi:MAG: hypothetical protein WD069_03065 [Planctomycetales bacterium]
MGLWSKIKGWLNIGGAKVSIVHVEEPITAKVGAIAVKFNLASKNESKINSITCRLIAEETKGKGEDKETNKTTLAEEKFTEARTVMPGSNDTIDLQFGYNLESLSDKLAKKGGVLGAVGKVGAFTSKFSEKGIIDYYVEVECDVEGTPFDPSDRVPVRVHVG